MVDIDTAQSSNITSHLSAMGVHPFLQAAASDAGSIAKFFLREFVDGSHVMFEANRAPPCGLRQLFI
ncbi:hypothetical protein PHYSODRAFT_320682 [Phytophthora sojae]|uniref:Uncharacterized protein n=1 Tax=Phytophthora sojae (strain P6497) TaxID=1094619 RepID=G4YE83_PHYSP|nr:hypothetical protein PHYSODRAFT_320682 [Phytophthora sojae]EGZ26790.1 hypothetical protein PHYSODRAFT_320682 [Phytophthora sojae]|eukprot:XP_009514065.1 hypothetical protein PHYSODRAFT_320682 [Phytophthora sojae]